MNLPTISQDSINAAVEAACDLFDGADDSSLDKDHVLTMLFLKSVSDAWQEHHDDYQRQYGDTAPDLIDELLKTERFVLPPGIGFEALHKARFEPGNGERIDRALHAIENANITKLRGMFQHISFNAARPGDAHRKNVDLRRLLEHFATPALDLSLRRVGTLDVIGNAFESVIGSHASANGKNSGVSYTPPQVSKLMARLMDPRERDDICEQTCGSGSLLLQCSSLIRARTGSRRYALFGQEVTATTWAFAKMNLFLHGEDNHRIERGDALRHPKLLDGEASLQRFDIVVADPPSNMAHWGHESAEADRFGRFDRGVPPRTKGDYAFILHMIATLKPDTGRMAVVVPHGVLFRGAAEGRIRRQLVEENLIDAVIGLPDKLFYGTGRSMVVLVVRHGKSDDNVLFIDASTHFEAGRSRNVLRELDLQRVLATCAARVSVEEYAHLATSTEIADNDFNLNIARYIGRRDVQAQPDAAELQQEREQLKTELAEIDRKMRDGFMALGGAV